jgi:hypothetical protein
MTLRSSIAVAAAAALLAACGGEPSKPAAGTQDNPAVGKTTQPNSEGRLNEAAGAQDSNPDGTAPAAGRDVQFTRSAPCKLVSRSQAGAILGAPVRAPLQAPQGPTCIYRTKTGDGFVTLAIQPVDISSLTRKLGKPQRVDVSHKLAYCGSYGQRMLYAEISRGWVLSVAAPCSVATRFAAKALQQIGA